MVRYKFIIIENSMEWNSDEGEQMQNYKMGKMNLSDSEEDFWEIWLDYEYIYISFIINYIITSYLIFQ